VFAVAETVTVLVTVFVLPHPTATTARQATTAKPRTAPSLRPLSTRGHDLRATSSVVRDGIVHVEECPEAAVGRLRCVENSDLVVVRVDTDVRRVLLADHQHPSGLLAPILKPVSTTFATREGDNCSLR